ncbi:MAG TPA: hypothetical protein VMS81_05450 [Methanomicrobiales archaeon]|nr:hypothetical protein [Methanomicrobiales archaeon]
MAFLAARISFVLSGFLLILGVVLSGCIVFVPLPVPVQAPAQATPAAVTPGEVALQVTPPFFETVTETPVETQVLETTTTPTPAPVPTVRTFNSPLSREAVYSFTDNVDFHALSVGVSGTQMRTGIYYTSAKSGNPQLHLDASPGSKFLMVGVDFYMNGIRKEGKSSIFMTPLPSSFEVWEGADSYGVLNATDIPNMEGYYIRDVGSLYRDRFIDKDDDGSGVLIFEVPQSFNLSRAYLTFCPRNEDSWAFSGYYRSPDDWDCDKDLVVWHLR